MSALKNEAAGASDEAYVPATKAGGHSMALRVADIIRSEETVPEKVRQFARA